MAGQEITQDPSRFSESEMIQGEENKLLYHTGLITLGKNCPRCKSPMRLQHKTLNNPGFSDFFWQCTGFYIPEIQCRSTQPFRPLDLTLVHKTGIPEMEIRNDALITIASESYVQNLTDKRMKSHLGESDTDILCPVHLTPMFLKQKKGPDNMPILDRYHLGCKNPNCSQTTKLKSFPQLAAYLQRQEGSGILV
ncbi:hypothetical protein VZG28_05680 [Synechococcus elongatus IITB4]|uniref:hypothetical protein n=1 Tax=Synechococcus elongatus TaxID=32046 RepID=UPI0030CDE379